MSSQYQFKICIMLQFGFLPSQWVFGSKVLPFLAFEASFRFSCCLNFLNLAQVSMIFLSFTVATTGDTKQSNSSF